jgi:hypothetical protein
VGKARTKPARTEQHKIISNVWTRTHATVVELTDRVSVDSLASAYSATSKLLWSSIPCVGSKHAPVIGVPAPDAVADGHEWRRLFAEASSGFKVNRIV